MGIGTPISHRSMPFMASFLSLWLSNGDYGPGQLKRAMPQVPEMIKTL